MYIYVLDVLKTALSCIVQSQLQKSIQNINYEYDTSRDPEKAN